MQIIDSYRVVRNRVKCEVIDVLLEYDSKNPTIPAWERSRESMLIEWDMHNLGYWGTGLLGLTDKQERARSVDFDNNDEETQFYEYFFKWIIQIGSFSRFISIFTIWRAFVISLLDNF